MNSNQKIEILRELIRRREARKSLHAFILFMNPEYVVSDFSRTVCANLDAFLVDMMAGKRPILIFGAPPQHGKSDIVSRYFPAYVFGLYPNLRVGGLSYAFPLATDMNRDVQRIMMAPAYALLFPKSALNARRVVTDDVGAKRNSETFEIVGHKGSYVGQGVGGSLTGKPLDLGIIDDPIKNAQEALSPTVKEGVWKWYVSTFLTRLSKNSGQIIMATRWATDDLSGRVVAMYPRATVLTFPAINEKGAALIPELHPLEKLLETMKVLGSYFWSAMYQQSPKTLGGMVFKESGIRRYFRKDLPEKFDKIVISLDATFKDTDGSDYVVFQVWGKAGANSYLLDQVRDRMSFTRTKDEFVCLVAKWPQARRRLVEDKANGPAIIDSLKATVSGIIPVEPDGSKVARAHAMTAEWEAGNIWTPHPEEVEWAQAFEDEITTFPAAANDDQVDAMTQAVRDLYNAPKRGIFG